LLNLLIEVSTGGRLGYSSVVENACDCNAAVESL